MDINVEKFQRDFKRFCKSQHGCVSCPLNELESGCYNVDHLTEVHPVVQEWAEEHPAKTYLMDIKEKFPDMIIDNDFTMKYCVWRFYGENAKPKDGCVIGGCKKCWNREMK